MKREQLPFSVASMIWGDTRMSSGVLASCFSKPHLIPTDLIVFKGHEVVVYVFVASIFFHSRLEFFVVQHFPAIFQHKSVTEEKKTEAVNPKGLMPFNDL